ncbi:acetyl-CoA hydrolase/transferase C-terminal domain-containing protein [Halobacteriovorax sp. GB3]|uniref:acetyl-CoA hydrolase/transferase family protein n=1 Tax=Halobacteriovorax sp. GB3 TaxID=2719615 RepID=UPI0023627DF8|nr:acetyl-CoA hydrolase/transferase C-terminal domain-containing protein [Halobacteriovorax sp. GB3]MDD0851856.1 acetyl-CoA hydrolase/transferase C-terminal domain-containing protein [Halobacteriovorax sp. GB3]
MKKLSDQKELHGIIPNDARIFVQGGAATPTELLDSLVGIEKQIELIHIHTENDYRELAQDLGENLRITSLFCGSNVRRLLNYDNIDYSPCFLSEGSYILKNSEKSVDIAFIQVSSPDRHGYCSLGVSVDITLGALKAAKKVVALINKQMPRVHGDGFIHTSQIDFYTEIDRPIQEVLCTGLSETELAIGKRVAEIVEDGSTIQVGIGNVPNAVCHFLKDHKDLGVHSEMWSDGILELLKSGAVTNSKKKVYPGKTVSGFVMGSKELYDFIDDNPSIIQLSASFVNDPAIIKKNPKVVAINSAVEIDLTGQICADSVGSRIISGVGGQMDFMRGAFLSEGGKPITVITSKSVKGFSKIVPKLRQGAGVVTTRAHAHYIVTEYGVADLFGKTLNQRAKELIKISHPDDREELDRAWFDIKKSIIS